MFDTHIHTRFSTDSTMDIEAAIAKVVNLIWGSSLPSIWIWIILSPRLLFLMLTNTFSEYSRYRSDRVLLGIEIGMRRELVQETATVSGEVSF